MHKRNCIARPTIPAGYEAITFVKALQTLEKLVTQNHDFDFFEEEYKLKPHTSVYTYKIDSESKLQWNAQTIRKRRINTHERIKLHYTSRTHANTTHLPLISHLPMYPHLPARISGQGREGRGQALGEPQTRPAPL